MASISAHEELEPSVAVVSALRGRRPHGRLDTRVRLGLGLVALLVATVVLAVMSIGLGAKSLSVSTVLDALLHYDSANDDHLIVRTLRVSRTALGVEVGVALGLAGATMQGLTRNPLADPGIFGISAGASLAVVTAFVFFGVADVAVGAWFAFAGAALASILVYGVGSLGREGVTPVKLALAGAAVTAMLGSFTSLLLLTNADVIGFFTQDWLVGSLVGRSGSAVVQSLPFIAVGTVLALSSGRLLNALSLGDDVARSLGQRVGLARTLAATAVVVLAGAAVAAAGPIAFVGLMVPHVARVLTGPNYRWILPYSAVLGVMLILLADLAGRFIAQPGEIRVGTMTVLIGAPFFIYMVRRRKLAQI